MIKPILYHSFEEKESLEREIMASIPTEKKESVAKTLVNIFSNTASKTNRTRIHAVKVKSTSK